MKFSLSCYDYDVVKLKQFQEVSYQSNGMLHKILRTKVAIYTWRS